MATDFMTICERTGVWAALSERSYGGIGFDSDGILSGLIKAKADVRSTTTNYGFITGSYATFTMRLLYDYYVIHIPCLSCAYPFGVITGW